jgi:hypothetical protein
VIDYTRLHAIRDDDDERDVFPSFPPKERLACVDPASQLPGPAGPTLACPWPDPCTSNPHHPARLRQTYRPLHSTRRAGCHLCLATSKTSSRCEPKEKNQQLGYDHQSILVSASGGTRRAFAVVCSSIAARLYSPPFATRCHALSPRRPLLHTTHHTPHHRSKNNTHHHPHSSLPMLTSMSLSLSTPR